MAAEHVMFIGWDRPHVGREKMAVELFNSVLQYLGKQQKAGKVESFEPVLLKAHGGDLNGFVLVRGDGMKLAEMSNSEEFLDLMTRCAVHVGRFGTIGGWIGDGLQKQMARYMKSI